MQNSVEPNDNMVQKCVILIPHSYFSAGEESLLDVLEQDPSTPLRMTGILSLRYY